MKHFPTVLTLPAALLLFGVPACSKQAEASGPSGTRLTLSKPSDQTITQGETNKVAIKVDRKGFGESVHISFQNLPEGVTVQGEKGTSADTIPAGETSRDFVLVAAPTAQIVDKHSVTVWADGGGAKTSQTFDLKVKPK
jgi:hypothetical protein